jgi:glucosamine--fructose-6-phosphate aminotransferase (isomerizing)
MIEQLARLPSSAEPAAEFRYRNPLIESDTLYIVVSQSGETFDTLAALREITRKGGRVLGINNVVGSTIAREVDGGIYMHAGAEISVASTKAFSCMLACFMLLALQLGRVRDLSPQQGKELIHAIEQLPSLIEEALTQENEIRNLAAEYCTAKSAFFIGRTDAYPVALEGAQKLKEVSYIHAEAYPASELKHGPLALIDPDTPTVVVLPDNNLLDKSLSSLQEIRARKGPVISITNANDPEIKRLSNAVIKTPACHPLLFPLVMGVSLQLFAYYCAIAMGRDVDQPRNLAKSVTVE